MIIIILMNNNHNSFWLNHIRTLLVGARRVSGLVEGAGISVLIHCSDGWDRTSQLCSLSKLMLDPYYRTLEVCVCGLVLFFCFI